ncbi:hypothetical protein [Micromonospora auratinigra]|uniref:Uncharacterized protein n=1 Tax=Micromonospora auratinigra TaxID=261654 RepID=A0A1A8Z0T4_9ACTN|nr:hypothetical protein [Micromonospora auratinigra]SBT37400.1 hypothetical protein GA0070611_0192 [Micromonospora auratinigra]
MTEEHLDRLVRDADPYRPDVIGCLDGAKQSLLEEIMSQPTLERVAEPSPSAPRARRGRVRRLAGVLTAAAVLTGVFAVSTVLRQQPDEHRAAPPGTAAVAGDGTAVVYSPVALKAAEQNPRLLIDQPGWQVISVWGFTEQQGKIVFRNGGRELAMDWYPGNQYGGYHADRLDVSAPQAVKVDGWPADLFRYGADEFAVMLRPRDGSFVELRSSRGWSRKDFDALLGHVVRVDVRTWLAALPPEIVTPERVQARAAKVLDGVPLPPRFDAAALNDLGTNDAYQFGAQVISRVGCGWIAEWLRADKAGDTAARQRAADALRGSRQWRVLHDMQAQGDYPKAFWQLADEVAAGKPPAGYAEALGCR